MIDAILVEKRIKIRVPYFIYQLSLIYIPLVYYCTKITLINPFYNTLFSPHTEQRLETIFKADNIR